MKKAYSLMAVLTLMACLLTSCYINKVSGDGKVVSREIAIENYDNLHIEGGNIDLNYMQSDDAPYLKIETDQNIMDLLTIYSDGEVLTIRPKNRHSKIQPTRFIIVTNSTALREFKIAGGGHCNLGKGLTGEILKMKLAGGCSIKADSISITRLESDIAGSGTLSLSGKTESMDLKSAGSCKVKAFDLQTEDFNCKSAGSASIEITANKTISAKIAGSGKIRYKGDPNIIERSIAGSGSISKVD